jgi:peroxiredoxin family protein
MDRSPPDSEEPGNRLALVVKGDSYDDLLLAFSFAGIAASAECDVVMFFTNRAARRLRRGGLSDITADDPVGAEFMVGAEGMGFHDLAEMLRDLKATGRVRVYLCSRGARIWDIDADSMAPEVDSVMGTATFLLDEVPRANRVLTI